MLKVFMNLLKYIIAIGCLLGYYYINHSPEVWEFLDKADRVDSPWGLAFLVLIGLSQYVLLIVGVALIAITTWRLTRDNT